MKAINKLSVKTIEAAVPQNKGYKLADGEGLYLWITPAGGKIWRLDYRFEHKQKTAVFGPYPTLSLKDARIKKSTFRKLLTDGIDPLEQKKLIHDTEERQKAALLRTVQKVTLEWWEQRTAELSAKYRASQMARLRKHVFPFIGNMPIAQVTFDDLVKIIRRIEELGRSDMPLRVTQVLKCIFRYAKQLRYIPEDLTENLHEILKRMPQRVHRAAITNPYEVGELLRRIDAYRFRCSPAMHCALWLMPYTFLRSAELRGGRWEEIDFDNAIWHIPAERMKMRRPHDVPLARQVIEKLKELKKVSFSEYLFPSTRGDKVITAEGLRKTLFQLGYGKDEMCIHGFRGMASTLLNEKGNHRSDVIEAQLAHGEDNRVRAAYNHARYMPERTKMMQDWADYLDSLRLLFDV